MLCSGDSFPEEECLVLPDEPDTTISGLTDQTASTPEDEPAPDDSVGHLSETMVLPPELEDPPAVRNPLSLDRVPEIIAAISALETGFTRRLDQMQSALDRELRAESTREKVVDRLHAELQEYKNDFLLNVLRPVFVDLIQLHDDIGKIVLAQGEQAEADASRLLGLIGGFQQGIEDILYRQGVEPFSLEDDGFDPRKQRAFSTVPTEDPDLNKKVAVRMRKGFRSGEKIIRPEVVSVYSLKR